MPPGVLLILPLFSLSFLLQYECGLGQNADLLILQLLLRECLLIPSIFSTLL